MKVTKCSINSKKFKKCDYKKRKAKTNKKIDDNNEFYSTLLLIFSRIKNKPTPFLPPNNEDNNNKPEDNSTSDSNVSCPICKLEFTQKEIEKHLKDHLKNPLSKDFICDKLKINKSAIEFDNIFYKLTDFQIRELIETLQKYIEKYGENFINFLPDEMKQEIYYNFDKLILGM
ncbi:15708_t:CDS:1, partial [Gigaspora rosea]